MGPVEMVPVDVQAVEVEAVEVEAVEVGAVAVEAVEMGVVAVEAVEMRAVAVETVEMEGEAEPGGLNEGNASLRAAQVRKRNATLERIVKCTICKNVVRDTMSCDEDHLVCGRCFQNLEEKSCKICRQPISKFLKLYRVFPQSIWWAFYIFTSLWYVNPKTGVRKMEVDAVLNSLFTCKKNDQDLDQALWCPVCMEAAPLRYKCDAGHSCCASCLSQMHPLRCPTCRRYFGKQIAKTITIAKHAMHFVGSEMRVYLWRQWWVELKRLHNAKLK